MTQESDSSPAPGDIIRAHGAMEWHHEIRLPQPAPIGPDGRLLRSEVVQDRAGANSPFGDDVELPLPLDEVSYSHPPTRDQD